MSTYEAAKIEASGQEFYQLLQQMASALVDGETDTIAVMANLSALLFDHLEQITWVGFYRMMQDELVLGPFQGKPACVRIALGKGVCGTAVQRKETQIVKDVFAFPGHIACDPASRSELVIPILVGDKVIGVLDLDSAITARFTEEDAKGLAPIAALVTSTYLAV